MSLLGIYLFFVFLSLVITIIKELANLSSISSQIPSDFKGIYSPAKYKKSQRYLSHTTRFALSEEVFATLSLVLFIYLKGFDIITSVAIGVSNSYLLQGLIFAALLVLFSLVLDLPFSIYKTFVIEEKFGFNKTTPKVFITDLIKSTVILAIIGGVVWSSVLFVFYSFPQTAWIIAWALIVSFQLLISFLAPAFLLPLFNKFSPLPNGPLKRRIDKYLERVNFKVSGVFIMDGSKRSGKTNAFFTGFGKFKRIALFDTLIEKHTNSEIVAILAHEVGHYKRKHILKLTTLVIIQTGVLLYTASLLIQSGLVFRIFQSNINIFYTGLVMVGILWQSIDWFFAIPLNYLSRKFEYEADNFAVNTANAKKSFIDSLKKLSTDNLSHLTPHPMKVLFDYSHPPILERIQKIRDSK